MPAPDLRRDKHPTQPGMRPASYLPATASAPSLTAAARPEKTKFPGWLPSFRRLDATRHPMDLQFLVQASLPAHFPARHVRSRTKFENKRLLSSPIQSQGSKKTLIHPRYLKPEAGISFSHAIPAYSFVTLSVFSVFYNMPLYLPLYAVSFMRLSAFNPYIYFITDAYSASLILIFTSVLLCRHTPESRTQSFHPSVLLRRSVSKGRKVPTPLPQSPHPGQDADGFS